MSSTQTQYTVKVPLNPVSFPTTDKVVIWDASEGKFNLGSNSDCTKWEYNTGTTEVGISQYQVRFNNSTIASSTEIYIHKDALNGSNNWSDYFIKLTKTLCCTLTVKIPGVDDDYIVFDYNSSGSTFNGTYLKFLVSDTFAAPLVNDSNFTINNGEPLCLNFDLYRCENTLSPAGDTGTTENVPCEEYYQYSATTLNPISGSSDSDIFDITLLGNDGQGQFTLGLTGGTANSISIGDTVFLYITYTTYWGQQLSVPNIVNNMSLLFNGWNSNSTQTTGESLTLSTTQNPVFDDTNGYMVVECQVTDLTNGLSSGLNDLSKWCLTISEIPHPEEVCRGIYFQSIVNPNTWTASAFGSDISINGQPTIAGTLLNTIGGAGIITQLSNEIVCELPQGIYAFAQFDSNGDDTSSFWNSVIPGDVIRYKYIYDANYTSEGDYLDIHVFNIQTYTDTNGDEIYTVYGGIIDSFFDTPNDCSDAFNKPDNLICVNRIGYQELASLINNGYNGSISSLSSLRPSNNGEVSVDNSDIESITTLKIKNLDNVSSDFSTIFRTDISEVTLNYNKRKITYSVTGQTYNNGTDDVELNLGNIVYNGFTFTGGTIGYDYTTLVLDYSIFLTFDYTTVITPNSNSLVTSNGTSTSVVAKTAMTYDDQILTLNTDIKNYGDFYQRSSVIDITSDGTHTVHSIPSSSGNGFSFVYYVIEKTSGALRAGNVLVGTDGTNITYTDNSTPDAGGNTNDIEFKARLNLGNVNLDASVTNSTTWVVKIKSEILF